ncbi:MAG: hypothetical protein AAB392_00220 [Patescibacteria group bacterium]
MQDFENLNHANIVLDNRQALSFLKNKIFNMGFNTVGNPDYYEFDVDVFGIDEARELSLWAYKKPLANDRKVAILSINFITSEAQNALLKVFEEPPMGTYFFILIGNLGGILPTLLSRVQVHESFSDGRTVPTENKDFIQMSVAKKMQIVKKLSGSEGRELLKQFIKNLPEKIENIEDAQKMKKILIAKKLSSLSGSSPKMLLEWLTVSL